MNGIIICAAVLMAAAVHLLFSYYREKQKEIWRIRRMREGELYGQLRPMVHRAARVDIDQVRIEGGRISITTVYPPGTLGMFEVESEGFRPLTATDTRVLAELLAEEIAPLSDLGRYRLRRYTVLRQDGRREKAYVYTIRSCYKDALVQARQKRARLDLQ
ncbi:MAG: hypothetical protein MJ136_03185 [Clostridia bacterium]|nr:hypothetical protein [Clostridia bacterium]